MNPDVAHHGGGAWYYHRAFGLHLRSRLALPALQAGTAADPVDVEIDYAAVPAELPGAKARGVRFQSTPGRLLLVVDGVARFLVSEGRRIEIERAAPADDDDVRVFLLGSVLGALLHQRDDLVLHGSAVARAGECVIFLGHSGAGKSTLATAFRQRGWSVLTDDLCVVRPGPDGRMRAHGGFPQCKLWPDSLQALNIPVDGLKRIRPKIEKRALPLEADFATGGLPIRKVFLLVTGSKEELTLKPIDGPAKFMVLKNLTYRFGFLPGVGEKVGHFQHAMRLAQRVPLSRVFRSRELDQLTQWRELIEGELRQQGGDR